jgi:hypothetical protein
MKILINKAYKKLFERPQVNPPVAVVVQRDNMPNAEYVGCFNFDDSHPLWKGVMEMFHRLEGAQLDDPELTAEQKVAGLKLLNELRGQMGRNRKVSEQMAKQ